MNSKKHIIDRVGRLGTFVWFVRRHFLRLFSRFAFVGLVFWVCFCGGGVFLLRSVLGYFRRFGGRSNSVTESVPSLPLESVESSSLSSDLSRLTLISEDSCCFADGLVLRVGAELFNGRKLEKIDYARLCVCDDAGGVYWLRVRGKVAVDDRPSNGARDGKPGVFAGSGKKSGR